MCKMGELNTEKLKSDAWARRGGSPFADKRDWLNFFSICLCCTACQNWQVLSRNSTMVEEKGREGEDVIYIEKKNKFLTK